MTLTLMFLCRILRKFGVTVTAQMGSQQNSGGIGDSAAKSSFPAFPFTHDGVPKQGSLFGVTQEVSLFSHWRGRNIRSKPGVWRDNHRI